MNPQATSNINFGLNPFASEEGVERFENSILDSEKSESLLTDEISIGQYDLVFERESKPLYLRAIENITSKKGVNIACCLLSTALTAAAMFFVLPAAIIMAIKIAMLLIGVATCANNNIRGDEFRVDTNTGQRVVSLAAAQAQEQEQMRAMFSHFMRHSQSNF